MAGPSRVFWRSGMVAVVAVLSLAAVGVGLSGWVSAARAFVHAEVWGDGTSFLTLYSAARLAWHAQGSRLYDLHALGAIELAVRPSQGHVLAYLNPPFFAAVLSPLSALPFQRAYQLWSVLDVTCVAATVVVLWRALGARPRFLRIATLALFLLSFAVSCQLWLGQFSALLLFAWTVGFLDLRAGRDVRAGVALSTLLIKPELLLPVVAMLIWTRRRRALRTLIVIASVAVVASVAVLLPASPLDYPRFIASNAGTSANGTHLERMFGWNGLFGALLRPSTPRALTLLTLPLGLIGIGAALITWRREAAFGGNERFGLAWVALTLATLLADPNLYLQDLILLGPPVIFLVAHAGPEREATVRALALSLWVAAGLSTLVIPFRANVTALAMVLALGWAVFTVARQTGWRREPWPVRSGIALAERG